MSKTKLPNSYSNGTETIRVLWLWLAHRNELLTAGTTILMLLSFDALINDKIYFGGESM